MTALAFRFAGVEVVAALSGALYLPEAQTLVVADLHLEKGAALARRGALLPPYDTRATLAALGEALAGFAPASVVCLGDSFHDQDGARRLNAEDRVALQGLAAGRRWLWITGNHDGAAAAGIFGETAAELAIGPLTLRHCAQAAAAGAEVSGHFHPKASVAVGGRRLTARCFVHDQRRLILPAFGAFTGGLDVFDPAIASLLDVAFSLVLLGRRRVHHLPGCRRPAADACRQHLDPPRARATRSPLRYATQFARSGNSGFSSTDPTCV